MISQAAPYATIAVAEEVGPSADVEGGIAFEMSGVNGMTTTLLTNAHNDPDGRFSHSPLRLAGMHALKVAPSFWICATRMREVKLVLSPTSRSFFTD
jgi:hypothetical protein